jgi:anti-sigma factor RsiW
MSGGKEAIMWKLHKSEDCELVVEALEGTGTDVITTEALADGLGPRARKHMATCANCAAYFADLVATRSTLRGAYAPAPIFDAPWFATRVMARISAEDRAVKKQEAIWKILPTLASRVAGVAALSLVLAGGFMIRHSAGKHPNSGMTESLFDTAQAQISHEDILGTVSEEIR